MLRFLGRGSAFSDEHNSALMVCGDELILIDCPMSAFVKLKKLDLSRFSAIKILITHTHSDHISGIAMLIDYEYFIGHIPVTVIAPSSEVMKDMHFALSRLDGCEDDWYKLVTASDSGLDIIKAVIPTTHAPSLEGRCFGYYLKGSGCDLVYTGDSVSLDPFIPYLKPGDQLYTEAAAYRSAVHMYIGDIRDTLKRLTSEGISIFLMHMDNEDEIMKIASDTGAAPAPLLDTEDFI